MLLWQNNSNIPANVDAQDVQFKTIKITDEIVTVWWDNGHICYVLEKHGDLDFYSARSQNKTVNV